MQSSSFRSALLLVPALVLTLPAARLRAADEAGRLAELDRYWAAVSQSVKTGDFAAYRAGCHPEGVLVSEKLKRSEPMTAALARWRQGFDDTKAGRTKADVAFRFTRRMGDATTAHETGIFLYTFTGTDGQTKRDYVKFEALLVKGAEGWRIMMEYQKEAATEAEWQQAAAAR